jgi:hypothetical protein
VDAISPDRTVAAVTTSLDRNGTNGASTSAWPPPA